MSTTTQIATRTTPSAPTPAASLCPGCERRAGRDRRIARLGERPHIHANMWMCPRSTARHPVNSHPCRGTEQLSSLPVAVDEP
jgi:hypothetical protein